MCLKIKSRGRAVSYCSGARMTKDGQKQFSNHRLVLGVAWARGGREYMQDAFSLGLGVFDGHGANGEVIARFAAYNLFNLVKAQLTMPKMSLKGAIRTGCLALDEIMKDEVEELKDRDGNVLGGSTMCALWITESQVITANIGDSRAMACFHGKPIPLSTDHKPQLESESSRIRRAGGTVSSEDCPRVNGVLGVARSFGDYRFKDNPKLKVHQQLVSVVPEVTVIDIDDGIDFIVVASDGVWDMLSEQVIIDHVLLKMKQFTPLTQICSSLLEGCIMEVDPLTGLGSDNLTIIIAILR